MKGSQLPKAIVDSVLMQLPGCFHLRQVFGYKINYATELDMFVALEPYLVLRSLVEKIKIYNF